MPTDGSSTQKEFTLNQAIQTALKADPRISAAMENVRQTEADLTTTGLIPNPDLSAGGALIPLDRQFTVNCQGGAPQVDVGAPCLSTGFYSVKGLRLWLLGSSVSMRHLLIVTGAVVARLPKGTGPIEDRWQFNSLDLSAVYADWQRVSTEKEFNDKRLAKIRELTAAQYNSQKIAVERLRKLVATGTEAIRDLTSAEANLLQVQLEGQKDIYEAETALTVATRTRAALERKLFQDGIDPLLLEHSNPGIALIMADVPELKIRQVSVGQSCEARFYGLSEQSFSGKVRSLAPTLSPERHTLRVFFELNDWHDQFKPGMYAEIGLETDPRPAIMIPTDSVLHSQNSDYVRGPWLMADHRCASG
ncbi:RND family efflux transporter, MFP subunit [Methyloglobulus morosus KoM1]|uniref:RND family efflux transporter, MFP subunit n=1 Tax=Methyloglobulus morosus KoM1 TaxID=1116472 RepID=V5BLF6_9GAMM|nr:efflux RND transporter periplasmic adaptor subunit [Methyloglobulus morosus]ESS74140.1 RND family efflux transporter, MFP subunit [Methyloglobulus morosus KoM1]